MGFSLVSVVGEGNVPGEFVEAKAERARRTVVTGRMGKGRESVLEVAASTVEISLCTPVRGSKENNSFFQDFSPLQKTNQIEQFHGF
jgi:hypothetical protein